MVVDVSGIVLFANRALSLRIARDPDELCGRSLLELSADDDEHVRAQLRLCCRSMRPLPLSIQLRGEPKNRLRLRLRGALLEPACAGRPASVLLHCVDELPGAARLAELTRRVSVLRAELRYRSVMARVLKDSIKRSQAASRAKSEFLANMSHEIRTPLTAILGFSELLLDADGSHSLGQRQHEFVTAIWRNGDHLLRIVNNVLDLSKLEAQVIQTERIEFELRAFATELISAMRRNVEDKELRLELEFSDSVPSHLVSDPTRIRQILYNLISNAIKFTQQGHVSLRVDAEWAGPTQWITFEVSDTGIGIAPEDQTRLFEAFEQADASTTRRFGGTGLGLTISRRLAGLLGGSLELRSEVGRGSVFQVRLPARLRQGEEGGAASVPARDRAETYSAPVSNLRFTGCVLLVEDGVDNQRVLSAIMSRAGIDVTIAPNGQHAVELALQQQEKDAPFDVILMDMQMPVLDGCGATTALRAAGYEHPIVALTAHAFTDEKDRCLQAGCDDFASKPISRAKLLELLSRFLEPADDPS